MSRKVYRSEEEARDVRNAYQRNYQKNLRRQKEYAKAPHGGANVQHHRPPPDDVAADANRRNSAKYQSATAEICGDPKPGQSALDRQKLVMVDE